MKAPTGVPECLSLFYHFLENPLPICRPLPGDTLPLRFSILDGVDFKTLELQALARIKSCTIHSMDASGFCTSCGLNKPGIDAFEEFKKRE